MKPRTTSGSTAARQRAARDPRIKMTTLRKVSFIFAFFWVGVALTFAAISIVFGTEETVSDIVGAIFLLPWWLTLKGGTQILPESVTGPYDPIGHPLLHILGVIVNGAYLGTFVYVVFIAFKRRRQHGSRNGV